MPIHTLHTFSERPMQTSGHAGGRGQCGAALQPLPFCQSRGSRGSQGRWSGLGEREEDRWIYVHTTVLNRPTQPPPPFRPISPQGRSQDFWFGGGLVSAEIWANIIRSDLISILYVISEKMVKNPLQAEITAEANNTAAKARKKKPPAASSFHSSNIILNLNCWLTIK